MARNQDGHRIAADRRAGGARHRALAHQRGDLAIGFRAAERDAEQRGDVTTLKNTKARIAQLKRDARKAGTLQEQDGIQRELSELERKQRRLRQEIFAVEDEIIEKRDALIASITAKACPVASPRA